ncbi:MAG: hypothetical protein HMLKMBBP_02123 [Planctomycetes bacterium]|nr:hypothetical protein [Planctomycetota bacterium]
MAGDSGVRRGRRETPDEEQERRRDRNTDLLLRAWGEKLRAGSQAKATPDVTTPSVTRAAPASVRRAPRAVNPTDN